MQEAVGLLMSWPVKVIDVSKRLFAYIKQEEGKHRKAVRRRNEMEVGIRLRLMVIAIIAGMVPSGDTSHAWPSVGRPFR